MNGIKAIIVDDEASGRRLIANLVSRLNPNFEIVGEAGSISSAFDLITEVKPDLVFLDVKMPGGSGFTLLNMFSEITFEIVFISGFDNYALKAFEFNALDYVLKPVNPVKFAKTLHKVQLRFETAGMGPNEIKNILKSYDVQELIISKISVHNGNNVVLLDIASILYIRSEEGCTLFKMVSEEKYTSSKELSDFDFILENYPYMLRVNKSMYINIKFISSYSKGTNCFLTMKDQTVIEIPRRKKSEILELLARSNVIH
jgi:two-component system LytT family response regulator